MVDLETLLRGYRARLDDLNEQRRLSDNQADHQEILAAIEAMIEELTRATLRHLGEPAQKSVPAEEAILQLSTVIAKKSEQFVEGAPVGFLADLVARQEQNLRDIQYLQQGLGLGSGRPKPLDMKWDHPSSVESDVLGTFSRLIESLRKEGAEIKRLIPEVQFDLASTRLGIIKLLDQEFDPPGFMGAALDLGESQTGAVGWDAFRELPYHAEVEARVSFFVDVVTREPPARPLAGFYAGIAYPSRGGETVADLQLMGSDTYQVDDEGWFARINYNPSESYAHSEVLASIYRMAYAPGGLGNAADYTLCLAWGSYLARACARRYLAESGSDFVGARVGFSGGDWIDLGWVRPL